MIKRVALSKLERTTLPSSLRQLTIPEEDEAEASGRMAVWGGLLAVSGSVGSWAYWYGLSDLDITRLEKKDRHKHRLME